MLVLTVAAWLPLLVRPRWPLPVLAATTAVECLHLAVLPFVGAYTTAPVAMGAYQPVPVATMVAAFTVPPQPLARRLDSGGRRPARCSPSA